MRRNHYINHHNWNLYLHSGICLRGAPETNIPKIDSGRDNRSNNDAHANWQGSNKRHTILPQDDKQSRPAIELSTIQKIASDNSKLIIVAPL